MNTLFNRGLSIFIVGAIIGLFLGVVIGLTIQFITHGRFLEISLLVIGAIFGLFFEVFYDNLNEYITHLIHLNPLSKVLGTITSENSYIYVSPFRRIIEESPLYRIDPDREKLTHIRGTPFVYGRGDAIALALILRTIEKVVSKKHETYVQDGEEVIDQWGRSALCIGAHNRKTREILGKFERTGYRFVSNYSIITKIDSEILRNEQSDEVYVKGVRIKYIQDSSAIDYGVIIKIKDQFHQPFDKTIIVIAGLGDVGTAGAAYYLFNHYSKLPYEDDEFAVLIEVPSGYQSARKVDFDSVSKFLEI